MLAYVSLGGATVTSLSVVTHAIGFLIANSTLAIAIILNIMSYYTIFCCIVDLIKHLKVKKMIDEGIEDFNEKPFPVDNVDNPDNVVDPIALEKEFNGKIDDK